MSEFLIRDLVYSVSSGGKTSWWLRLARHLWYTQHKKTRWYLGDGGGATLEVEDADQFLEIMQYNLWDHPFETLAKCCEGYWPIDHNLPNSRLLPTSPDLITGYGLFVYEGLTVASDYMMGDRIGGLAQRMSKGEVLNNDTSFKIKDGDLTFGGNARTHYGFTQRRILDLIERTRALPLHVGWTAHERKIEDEDVGKEKWIGPDVSGRALTMKVGASFGNTVHLMPVKVTTKGIDPLSNKPVESVVIVRRAYTRVHHDPEQRHYVQYYANTRIDPLLIEKDPNFMPEWMDPDPIAYYTRLQEARVEAARLAKAAAVTGAALKL